MIRHKLSRQFLNCPPCIDHRACLINANIVDGDPCALVDTASNDHLFRLKHLLYAFMEIPGDTFMIAHKIDIFTVFVEMALPLILEMVGHTV